MHMHWEIYFSKNQFFANDILTNTALYAIIPLVARKNIGVWHSLVVRLVRDQEVASSNLVTPTKSANWLIWLIRRFFLYSSGFSPLFIW